MIMSRWSTFPRYVATDAALGSAAWRSYPVRISSREQGQ